MSSSNFGERGENLTEQQYKRLKEDFVTGYDGSSAYEIYLAVFFIPLGVLLQYTASQFFETIPFFYQLRHGKDKGLFSTLACTIFDVTFTVIPMLLGMTFNDYIYHSLAGVVGLIAFFELVLRMKGTPSLQVKFWNNPKPIYEEKIVSRDPEKKTQTLRFLSAYRSVMMLQTCLAILAVDFTIFPRMYCKSEIYGISLMDIGTGSVIFSSAIVSRQARDNSRGIAKAIKSLSGALPLLILGAVRMGMIKSIQYQEHVSEYGTHWNFFVTLAVVNVVAAILNPLPTMAGMYGGLLIIGYQWFLSKGFSNYIIVYPRNDFFSHNREGIMGAIAYTAIYFFGLTMGNLLTDKSRNKKDVKRYHGVIVTFAVVSGIWALVAHFFLEKISRRLTNMAYVMFVINLNLTFMWLLLIVEKLCIKNAFNWVIEAINFNQLPTFLIANLLTGAINISMRTLFSPPGEAFGIVLGYAYTFIIISAVLKYFNFRLKFWQTIHF